MQDIASQLHPIDYFDVVGEARKPWALNKLPPTSQTATHHVQSYGIWGSYSGSHRQLQNAEVHYLSLVRQL